MITKKSWDEFRSSGMLWWINRILHTFGWAIVYDYTDDLQNIKNVYPARVKFRGFDETSETDGFKHVSQFLVENITEIKKEANE